MMTYSHSNSDHVDHESSTPFLAAKNNGKPQQSMSDEPQSPSDEPQSPSDDFSDIYRKQATSRRRRRLCYTAGLPLLLLLILVTALAKVDAEGGLSAQMPFFSRPQRGNVTVEGTKSDACKKVIRTDSGDITFKSVSSFSLEQRFTDKPKMYFGHQYAGRIAVFTGHEDQQKAVKVSYDLFSNMKNAKVTTHRSEDQLTVFLPPVARYEDCLDFRLNIYIKKGVQLDKLEISSDAIDIMQDTGSSRKTIDAKRAAFTAKAVRMSTYASNIRGTYPLIKTLDLKTKSGNIDVLVDDTDKPTGRTSELVAHSMSGNIDIRVGRTDSIAAGDIDTEISTTSGNIRGRYMHGSKSSFKSMSGTMNFKLLPLDASKSSSLVTDMKSGSLDLRVLEPFKDKSNRGLVNLRSEHHCVSGTQRIRYPGTWQGVITGDYRSGNVKVRGSGVKKMAKGEWVKGAGPGTSRAQVTSSSGNIDLLVGNDP